MTQIIGHFRDGGFFWQRSSFVGAKSGYSWVWHRSRLRSVSLFTPYLSPIHTKLVPQPRQLVLAVHHASVESYLLMCANTDIPLIMFINCGRVPYERFFCNGINKSSSWTYQSNRMINKCHICSKWPPPSGTTLHLQHFKCSPRQFNEPQNIFFNYFNIFLRLISIYKSIKLVLVWSPVFLNAWCMWIHHDLLKDLGGTE